MIGRSNPLTPHLHPPIFVNSKTRGHRPTMSAHSRSRLAAERPKNIRRERERDRRRESGERENA
ncbi:hypothetical protein Hanom_Chr06g00508911 [Helianthus anomalus]